jgi:tetratricopeptide (TPR) repeat protein
MGLGVAQVRLGEATQGMQTLNRAITLAKQEKNNAVLGQAYFNLACAFASQNKQNDALTNLKLAAKLIPARDLEVALDKEKDLEPLKESTEYRSIAAQVHLDAAKPPKKPK